MRPLVLLLAAMGAFLGLSSRPQAATQTYELTLALDDSGSARGMTGETAPTARRDSSRGYLGLSLSAANIGIDQQGVASSHLIDATYSIFGGNDLWKYVSIEYGYATLGSYSADYQFSTGAFDISEHHEVKFDRSAFVSLVGWVPESWLQALWRHPEHPNLRLYGKIGASYWHAKLQMSGQLIESGVLLNSYGSQGEGSGVSPLFGLGAHYQIGADTAIRLDWTEYNLVGKGVKLQLSDGTQSTFGGKSVSVVGLALVYSYWP